MLQNLKTQPTQQISESERLQISKEANQIFGKIADVLKGAVYFSKEVQQLIKKHCEFVGKFHETSKEVYRTLAKLYSEHPEYRKQLDPIHPDLANFMAKAMILFTNNTL